MQKIVVKLKVRNVILLLTVGFVGFYFLANHYIAKAFIDKNKDIVKNIAKNINDQDILMTQNIEKSLIAWSEMLNNNKANTLTEMIQLRNRFHLSHMGTKDISGRMELDTDGTHLPGGPFYDVYGPKAYSLFQPDAHPSCKELLINPNVPIVTPLYRGKARNVPSKLGLLYNDKVKKILEVQYNRNEIDVILQNNVNLNNDILYIILSDQNATPISHAGEYKEKPSFNIKNYKDTFDIKNEKDLIISLPASDLKEQTCYFKDKNRLHSMPKNNLYFYILNIAFSKAPLNKQLKTIKIIFILSWLSISSILYVISRKRDVVITRGRLKGE